MASIPAREACVFWNPGEDLAIGRVGGPDIYDRFFKSGGACYSAWRKLGPEELYFRLLQLVCELVISERVPLEKVHAAFCVVPEYRLVLPADHRDALKEKEMHLVKGPHPKFTALYPPL